MATSRIATDQSTAGRLLGLWRSARVAIGVAVAEAAVVWIMIEDLSNRSVGSIAFAPIIVAMLLLGVGPILLSHLLGLPARLANLALAVVAGGVLIKGLAFPDVGWLGRAWIDGTGSSLIFRESRAVMPVWVPILVTVAAWWWRQRRGEYTTDDVRVSFRLGAVLLVTAATIGAFTGLESQGPITTAATVFFAAILLAMSWARQAAVHPGELSGGTTVAAATSIAGVVVVVLVATALVAITSPTAFDTLLWLLSPVFWLVRNAVLGLSFLFLIVLYPLFWLVGWLLSLRSNTARPEVTPPVYNDPSASPSTMPSDSTASLPDEFRIVLASLALVVLLAIVARQVLRRAIAATTPTDVEQHVEFDLRSLLRRRRPDPVEPDIDPLAALRNDPRFQNTVAIREIYAAFLRRAASAGLARGRPETARHHAQRIAASLGTRVDDIRTLTAAYGPTRYGETPATDEQRREVVSAWDRVAPRLSAAAGTPPTSRSHPSSAPS